MDIKTDKNAIWVLIDNVETLIWESDLAPGMTVIDLTAVTIDSILISSLREQTTTEKYDIYYNQILTDGTKDQITERVTTEKRKEIETQVRQEMPQATEEEIEAEITKRMEAAQPEITAKIAEELDAYVRGLIEENVQTQLNVIREQNAHKEDLKERATRLSIEPEEVAISTQDDNFIKSIDYLPDFLQEKPVFKDATKLLDVLISDYDDETIKEIYQAYCDTIYKWPGYGKLSYGAKITLLQEKGFGYMLDLLLHMYDESYEELCKKYDEGEITSVPTYEEYVKQKCDDILTKITMLFNLLYVLKGRTLGLELALELIGLKSFVYMPWNIIATNKGSWPSVETLPMPGGSVEVSIGDVYSIEGNALNYYMFNGVAWHPISSIDDYLTPREPFTADMQLYGIESATLQARLNTFVRNYMLPKIDVTLRFDAKAPEVLVYPSGAASLINGLYMEHYTDDSGVEHKRNLTNIVSDEHWMYAGGYQIEDLKFGIPEFNDKGFQGTVNLTKSYVEDPDGTKHYLYGSTPKVADIIKGTALSKIKDIGYIDNYEGDYLQVPLEDYVEIDIVTGEQQNPHYVGDEFIRDSILKYYSCLSIEGIHLAKTIQQMEQLKIEDFSKEYDEYEVWLGRSTDLECVSGWNHNTSLDTLLQANVTALSPSLLAEYPTLTQATINAYITAYKTSLNGATFFKRKRAEEKVAEYETTYPHLANLKVVKNFLEFTTTQTEIREETGIESTHLVYCEEALDTNYTGIGDIGILGANDYFIYNGMLMYHGDKLKQVGEDKTWTDVGASHATSEMYYTPCINAGHLKVVHQGELLDVSRNENNLAAYLPYAIEYGQISVENFDEDPVEDVNNYIIRRFTQSWVEIAPFWDELEENKWENITGFINEHYTAFGICDGRLYKIFQNPLYGSEGQPFLEYEPLDTEQGWTYITGAHYSNTYKAYGIKNRQLYKISDDGFEIVKLTDPRKIEGLSHITQEDNVVTYDTIYGKDKIQIVATEDEITSILFNGVIQEFTVLDNIYTTENLTILFNEGIESIKVETEFYNALISYKDVEHEKYDEETGEYIVYTTKELNTFELTEREDIIGWTGDCISRYHHCNNDYTTYGISHNILYAITNETVKILDDDQTHKYTAVCGYYNNNSPRTFAYAICNNKLYELQGETIVAKETEKYWTEIHGCTTANNNFVICLAKENEADTSGKIYKVNAKTTSPEQLDNNEDWISIFGRYTTSTAKSANCYGYGIRNINGNKKLYEINKNGISIISGFWKAEGSTEIADLEDYNIHELKANLPDGTTANSIQEIKEITVYPETVITDYDIYVTYTTKGFNNNTRYTIKTGIEDTNCTYTHPSECRVAVYEDHCYDLFDTDTSLITGFIQRNFTLHGSDIINGAGEAERFKETNTYIELPGVENHVETDIKFTVLIDDNLNPVILDKDNKSGIFYGKYNNIYGIFLKYQDNDTDAYLTIKTSSFDASEDATIRFVKNTDGYDVYLVGQGKVFSSSAINNKYVYIPTYLGGNGEIFGNPIIYLLDSFVQGNNTIVHLFENGRYFSVETLEQDLIECLETSTTQDTQKVIEITKQNSEVLELSMDTLYSTLEVDCTADNLTVATNYNWNRLQHDPYEGETYTTLTYSGAYELNPELITSVPEKIGDRPAVEVISDFENTGIVDNLTGSYRVYFKLSTDFTDEILVKSGSSVTYQRLFATEENEAYTNKYLLQSEITKVADVDCTAVPSGIIYEFETNAPATKTRTLIYNNDQFELDDNRIQDYSKYYFDSYNATLTFYPQYEYDESVAEYVYVDAWATIKLNADETSETGTLISSTKLKIDSSTAGEKFLVFDTTELETDANKYYKIDTERVYTGYSKTWLTEVNPEPLPKDQLHYDQGKCWNYNSTSYHILKGMGNGLVLCIETDDDTSKDQCVFGFGNNSLCIIDNVWSLYQDGVITKSGIVAWDSKRVYLSFTPSENKYTVAVSNDLNSWTQLFTDVNVYGQLILGYGQAGVDKLPFNGKIDLARSYVLTTTQQKLYEMVQTTNISKSVDDVTYTTLDPIVTDFAIDSVYIGYKFTGTLDCFYSKLLKSYDLQWVENGIDLDTKVKQEIKQRDPSYNPELDENTYTIKEYGIQIEGTPKRWDTVKVTYTTVDKAYYMLPNTSYKLKMEVIDDKESGKMAVDIVDNPTLVNGIVSDFTNGHIATLLTWSDIVIKFNLTDLSNQILCGYSDTISASIFIEDGKVKYFDDANKHELFDAQLGTLYLKLYSTEKEIEYSFDGETFIKTDIIAPFTAYDTFNLGVGYVNGEADYFHGSIDLCESYNQGSTKEYLFTYYKKVIPYIYDGTWKNITLEPLLTINNYVELCRAFDGSIDLYKSGLCLENTKYWTANKITIKEDDEIIATVIRDDVEVDPGQTKENETVRINPEDLYVQISGIPRIGDKVKLTYNSWFLFREKNTTYEFRVITDDTTYISFNKKGEREYKIYETTKQNMLVNTGYQFNGSLSVIDSTRQQMPLCDNRVWYTFATKYKIYGEDDWDTWIEFIREKGSAIQERMGYDLLGKHYLETSWVKTEKILTAFITYYNYEYITPVGDISFSLDGQGVVTNFSNDAYLQMIMEKLKVGSLVRFWLETGDDIGNQGVSTFIKMQDGYFHSTKDSTQLNLLRPNYTYIEQYRFGGGLITVKDVDEMAIADLQKVLIRQFGSGENFVLVEILGYNMEGDYEKRVSDTHTITLLPYNPNKEESQIGYYITDAEMAAKVTAYYRKQGLNDDPESATWIAAPLQKQLISYFGKTLNVYCSKITFPNADFEYYVGDKIQYKLQSDTTTYQTVIAYNDMIVKQKAVF